MKILLATLHAKYVHSSLALPCLAAACREMDGVETTIREFTVNEPTDGVLRSVVSSDADVVAFSCYIWNIGETLKIASDLKKVRPETCIILGGPEVSYGVFGFLELNPFIDCVVRGEGEETFRECVSALQKSHSPVSPRDDATTHQFHQISGITFRDGDDIIATPVREPIPALDTIPSPIAAGLIDLAKPLVYYETSRGCPFSCAFCMSSLEKGVRSFSMSRIEDDLRLLMGQGAQTVKLVDRTFNYDANRAVHIWEYILRHNRSSRFHFEIAADLLTSGEIEILRKVPPGMFRFEIGVQSGGDETLARVERKSDLEKLFAAVERLRRETGVTLHLDLVAGLPHEDFAGFLASLQRILEANPHHVQVEPLKVLKGSPMRKIAAEEGYAFSETPPYKVLQTPWLTFEEIGRIETVARLLDLYYNSGRFEASLMTLARTTPLSRFFSEFARFWDEEESPSNLSLHALYERFWRFAGSYRGEEAEALRDPLRYDFCRADYPIVGRLPGFFDGDDAGGHGKAGKEAVDRIVSGLRIEAGSRVRTFVGSFDRDFSGPPWRDGPVRLLFVYVSRPGRGLDVRVFPLHD